jgi:hypothetical protein
MTPTTPVPQPLRGEVLEFRKGLRAVQVWTLALGALLHGLVGTVMAAVAASSEQPVRYAIAAAVLWCLAFFLAGSDWYFITHWPRIIVGFDRLQLLWGKRVHLEIPYDNIAEIAIFTGCILSLIPFRAVGIKLLHPEQFDAAAPRLARRRQWLRRHFGFDFAFRDIRLDEPLERCLEVMLRCYHRFRTERGLPPSETEPRTRS